MKKPLLVLIWIAGCGAPSAGGNGVPDAAAPFDAAGPGGGSVIFQEPFSAAEGAPWPAPWKQLGGVATATVAGGRGRLTPLANGYSLARMGVTLAERDVDATFVLRFEQHATQGVGFYVRQNGGYLQGTSLHGGGYAVFIEGVQGFSRIGLWREVDGTEMEFAGFNFPTPLQSNVTYAVRFRVAQASPTSTRLQARLWDAAQAEPATWLLDEMDAQVGLQGARGGIAVDSYSSVMSGTIASGTLVANVVVTRTP